MSVGIPVRSTADATRSAAVDRIVLLSERPAICGIACVSVGKNVRIDDFGVLSPGAVGAVTGDEARKAVLSPLIPCDGTTCRDCYTLRSRGWTGLSGDEYSGAVVPTPGTPGRVTAVVHANVTNVRHGIGGSEGLVPAGETLGKDDAF
jgi:hypothetical protein